MRSIVEKDKLNDKKKIYISRRRGIAANRSRVCLNEADVESELVDLGFDIIIPDELDIKSQISIFSNSDFVIGCSGAALFNTVFCEDGTKLIDVESAKNWIYGHVSLFSSFNLNFGVHWAKPIDDIGGHRPFHVNLDKLIERVHLFV